mmetsp:Transcript_13095/g.55806  ORF Transcript_13095/g.55806 Transcript_13095/m.55806 type:complete len:236 (-) Transcript_13095:264-971(-)
MNTHDTHTHAQPAIRARSLELHLDDARLEQHVRRFLDVRAHRHRERFPGDGVGGIRLRDVDDETFFCFFFRHPTPDVRVVSFRFRFRRDSQERLVHRFAVARAHQHARHAGAGAKRGLHVRRGVADETRVVGCESVRRHRLQHHPRARFPAVARDGRYCRRDVYAVYGRVLAAFFPKQVAHAPVDTVELELGHQPLPDARLVRDHADRGSRALELGDGRGCAGHEAEVVHVAHPG